MVYKFAQGFQLKVKPQVVGEHLEKLEARHGRLTPKIVLDEARSDASPLHPEFEWDDALAAEKWREDQAGYILRSVIAVVEGANGERRVVRAFVNAEQGDGYHSIQNVLASPVLSEKLLTKALHELRTWQERYSIYKELAHLCSTVDKTLRPYEEKLTQYQIEKVRQGEQVAHA